MTWWRALLRATDRHAVERDARRLDAMVTSLDAFRDSVTALENAVATASGELRRLQRQGDALIALRMADADAPARMRRLERILDADRVMAHVLDAVGRAELTPDPVPHLLVRGLLPDDIHEALVDAVPPESFFDEDPGRQELPLPLTFAPVHAIATWTFVSRIARKTFGPAIVARFDEAPPHLLAREPGSMAPGAALSASRGRIAVRRAGDVVPKDRRRTAQVLTTFVPLTLPGEEVAVSLAPHAPGADGGSRSDTPERASMTLPANSALTVLSLAGSVEFLSRAGVEPARTGVCMFEFPIGPERGSKIADSQPAT